VSLHGSPRPELRFSSPFIAPLNFFASSFVFEGRQTSGKFCLFSDRHGFYPIRPSSVFVRSFSADVAVNDLALIARAFSTRFQVFPTGPSRIPVTNFPPPLFPPSVERSHDFFIFFAHVREGFLRLVMQRPVPQLTPSALRFATWISHELFFPSLDTSPMNFFISPPRGFRDSRQ